MLYRGICVVLFTASKSALTAALQQKYMFRSHFVWDSICHLYIFSAYSDGMDSVSTPMDTAFTDPTPSPYLDSMPPSEEVHRLANFLISMIRKQRVLDCPAVLVLLYWAIGDTTDAKTVILSNVVTVVELLPLHTDSVDQRFVFIHIAVLSNIHMPFMYMLSFTCCVIPNIWSENDGENDRI